MEKNYAEKIKNDYSPKQTTKMDELRALDKKVRMPATVFAYVFGTVAVLILGTGMCFAMKVIGNLFVPGIVIGCIGIALCISNYYIYRAILKARKRKYGEQVLSLSNELLNN